VRQNLNISIPFLQLLTSSIVSQNPQVEGINQHRHIFNSKVPPPPRLSCLAQYDSDSGLFLLNAGTAHGVTLGAEFAFRATQDTYPPGKPLHTFVVNNSASFFSILRPTNDASWQSLPTVFTVFQVKPGLEGTIRLYLSSSRNSPCFISVCHYIRDSPHDVEFVNSPDDAHLELTVRDNQLVFSVSDEKATIHGFDHQFPTMQVTRHNLTSFLKKAKSFYRERDRHTGLDPEVVTIVTLEFYKLGATHSKFEDIPDPQLGESGPNLYSADTIDFTVEEGCVYGVKLTNLSSRDLYPTLFYLGSNDLSIGNVYYFPLKSQT
jgi:hypothetical protein